MTTTLLSAALSAAARGWHVFPTTPGQKTPAVRRWEDRATTDPARIRRCWSAGAFGVGIACGPSGLVVVDLDTRKPDEQIPAALAAQGVTDGMDVFLLVCAAAGVVPPLDTYTVTTGRAGTHLYFAAPAGVRLRNTEGDKGRGLGWHVDTRAGGGYVIAAGSTVAGRPYVLTDDVPLLSLPGWLAAALAPPPLPAPPPPVALSTATRRGRYLDSAVRAEVARVTGATKGERNAALYQAACALGQLVAGGSLTEQEVRDALMAVTPGHISVGAYTYRQAVGTITSGLRAGAKRSRTVTA